MDSNKNGITPVKRLFRLLGLEKQELTLIYGYSILGGVIGLTLPLGIQAVMSLLVAGEISTSWYVLIGLIIVGITFSGVLQILQISIMERLQQRIMVKTSFDLAFRIPRWKLEEIMKEYTPELLNRFFDIVGVQKGLAKLLVGFLSAFLQIIFALILLSLYHSFFAFYGLVLFTITIIIFYFTFNNGLRTSLLESKHKYKISAWLEDLARTMNIVKLAGDTNMHMHKTDTLVSKWLIWRKEHFKILLVQFSVLITFKTFITGGLLIIGGYLVFSNELSIAQFVASEVTIILIINAVEKLVGGIEVIYDVLTSIEKLGQLMDIELEMEEGIPFSEIDTKKGVEIEFDKVSYNFPNSLTPTIDNISFKIKPGEKICITGMPGSGKSTLINLAATLFHNYKGHIIFNGVTIKNLDLISLRSFVGENLEKKDLIQGTISENISMGRDDITYEDIRTATDAVGLSSFIQKTEHGLDTMLVPEDITVSSSVVTKIAMARSIAEKPHLFVLDNFLLNLQEKDKKVILESLLGDDKMWTLIGASSDEMFAKKCDRIIVLDEGKILHEGTYEELKSKPYFDEIFT